METIDRCRARVLGYDRAQVLTHTFGQITRAPALGRRGWVCHAGTGEVRAVTKIVIVGEAFGEQESRIGAGFVGPSGIELLRMLHEAGIIVLTQIDRDYISGYYQRGDPRCVH